MCRIDKVIKKKYFYTNLDPDSEWLDILIEAVFGLINRMNLCCLMAPGLSKDIQSQV